MVLRSTTFSPWLTRASPCTCWEPSCVATTSFLFLGRTGSLLSVCLPLDILNSLELLISWLFTVTTASSSIIVWMLSVWSLTGCSTKLSTFTASFSRSSVFSCTCCLSVCSSDISSLSQLDITESSRLDPSSLSSSFSPVSCSSEFLFLGSSCWSCRS